ncbi:MAG: YegP family protein [Hyphomicrobiaceae bacterium]
MYYEYYQDSGRQWRWVAYAGNHEAIAVSSEAYFNERDCLHAIGLMKGSGNAPVRKR